VSFADMADGRPPSGIDDAALLEAIVRSTQDAVISTDLSRRITSWNPAAERLYGYSSAEALGALNALIIPPDRLQEDDATVKRLLAGESVSPYETVRLHKDGRRIDVSMTASAIRGPDGRIIGISKITRDLSARMRVEGQLTDLMDRMSETLLASRRLAAIVESSEDAIVAKDLNGVITAWNRAAERMFGYTPAEAIGQSIRIIVPDDLQDEETAIIERIGRGETIEHFETIRCRKDRACLPISLTVSPIRDEGGVVIGASKIARDITQRKRLEEQAAVEHRRTVFLERMTAAVARSLNHEQTLKDVAALAVPDIADWSAVDVIQEDGAIARLGIAHVDPAKIDLAMEIRRRYEDPTAPYSVDQVIKTRTAALIPDITDEMIAAAARGDRERIDLVRSLGLKSYMCVPLVSGGRALGALTLATGVSGRRYTAEDLRFAEDIASRAALAMDNARSYEQLQRANRLKDEFLATLSHELRTPLNAILGYARIVRGGMLSREKVPPALETIERNATALTQMVEDILDVSRIVAGKMRLNVQPVELPLILHEALETIRPAAEAKRIQLHTVFDPQVSPISGDPDRLRQIVWNLLSNAVKFTPKDGKIQLRLERINSSVEISVSDTGIGIPPEFLPHIFERFRQADAGTSRTHAGLGLGMAIVRNLV
jgi:PAS domain S-box-containing protein